MAKLSRTIALAGGGAAEGSMDEFWICGVVDYNMP
jgi:hypothetical protein